MGKRKDGQSIVEILTALAVVIIVILALIVVTTASIRNATFAKNQSLATQYAQELIEQARELRDRNKNTFFNNPASCGTSSNIPPFQLQRTCTLDGPNKMRVEVTVSWIDAKGTHQSKLITNLTKW